MTVAELMEKLKEMPSEDYLSVSCLETEHPSLGAMLKDVISGRRGIVFIWHEDKHKK